MLAGSGKANELSLNNGISLPLDENTATIILNYIKILSEEDKLFYIENMINSPGSISSIDWLGDLDELDKDETTALEISQSNVHKFTTDDNETKMEISSQNYQYTFFGIFIFNSVSIFSFFHIYIREKISLRY